MTGKLKVGIIGVGAIGAAHANAYQSTRQAEITALCDTNPSRLASEGERLKVPARFDDYRKLLKSDVEAVSICVGNALHRDVAVAAFKAGKHVLLEKPMALNARQAKEILAAARKSKCILQIGMSRRFIPAAQVVRNYIQAGELGEIYHMRAVMIRRRGIPGLGGWFTTKSASGGGPMIDLGVHWFDMLMWLSGLWKPTSVSAATYQKFGHKMRQYKYVNMWAGPPKYDGVFDVEDYATGLVRFGAKATMTFEIAWAANAENENFVEIFGDKGGVRLLDGNPLRILTEHQGRLADIHPRFDEKVNNSEAQARSFIAACRRQCPPAATGEEGLTAMKLIDGIYASSAQGKEVRI